MQRFLDFAFTTLTGYGGLGLVIMGLVYVVYILWKDNKDLRERNDRLTDRFLTLTSIASAKTANTENLK